MKNIFYLMCAGTFASGVLAWSAMGEEAVAEETGTVQLSRIDCGRSDGARDVSAFSDTHALDGERMPLVASCYLIRHGDDLMLWDTGYPAGTKMNASMVEQLANAGIEPGDVDYIGISHYHADHIGQARDFPGATLLIGKGDWDALEKAAEGDAPTGMGAPDPQPLNHWIAGNGTVDAVSGDRDIFGDGSVVMLDMPGHTPGHHALLVRLEKTGPVMLSGDVAHFTRNYESDGVPTFNTDRADSLASLDRFKRMAHNLDATVVIQHEPDDVAKLPALPASAD